MPAPIESKFMSTATETTTLERDAKKLLRRIADLKEIKRTRDYRRDAKTIGDDANELQEVLFPETHFPEDERIFRPRGFPRDKDLGGVLRDNNPGTIDSIIKHLDLWKDKVERLLRKLEETEVSEKSSEGNVFHKKGDRWEVTFNGDDFHLQDSKGVQCIAYLLARPNESISALEIARLGSQHESHNQRSDHMGLSGRQSIIDPDALQDYHTKLGEIEEDISNAKANCDEGRIQKLEKDKEAIIAEFGSALKRGGHIRHFADASEKARKSVTTEISRALEKIKAQSEAFCRYLNNSIHRGSHCIYCPTDKINCQP